MSDSASEVSTPTLRRRLKLPLLVLYGLGVTVGAGIYVLVGATADQAGYYAPISFLVAAVVVSFTGYSYAELTTRFPVSAGEAAYVRNGLKSKHLSLLVGLMVAASGVVSASAVTIGAAGYLGTFVPFTSITLTFGIVLGIALIATWGVFESVSIAAALTILELFGLALVIIFGVAADPTLFIQLDKLVPPIDMTVWEGIGSASLLAFFAFVGFEDLANIAEEAKHPYRDMPRAIMWTLGLTTFVYLTVVAVVVLSVPIDELSRSDAPLQLIFASAPPWVRVGFGLIATFATLNGVLIQMIMASRVIYGMADQGQLHPHLAYVHPVTHTPVLATILVAIVVLVLSLFFPIEYLAEATASIALSVFAIVNVALIAMKLRDKPHNELIYKVPMIVPVMGFATSSLLLGVAVF